MSRTVKRLLFTSLLSATVASAGCNQLAERFLIWKVKNKQVSDFELTAIDSEKVRLENTHLTGEVDYLVVPGFHMFIMNRDDVYDAVLAFLKGGGFREPTAENQR